MSKLLQFKHHYECGKIGKMKVCKISISTAVT